MLSHRIVMQWNCTATVIHQGVFYTKAISDSESLSWLGRLRGSAYRMLVREFWLLRIPQDLCLLCCSGWERSTDAVVTARPLPPHTHKHTHILLPFLSSFSLALSHPLLPLEPCLQAAAVTWALSRFSALCRAVFFKNPGWERRGRGSGSRWSLFFIVRHTGCKSSLQIWCDLTQSHFLKRFFALFSL